MADTARPSSQSYADTRVFKAHGQDPPVDLMELHQLQEVDEQRQAIIHGVVLPAAVFALQARTKSVGRIAISRGSVVGIVPGVNMGEKGPALTGMTR